MRLVLLRHGQTNANVLGQLDTAVPGDPLTDLGHRQAEAAPAGLAALGIVPEALFVSTLVRTQQTAVPLARATGLTPVVLDGLKEIQAGDLEMLDDHRSQGEYNATAFAWAHGDLNVRMPGGESGHGFFARYDAAIRDVVAAHSAACGSAAGRSSQSRQTVIVVSHGAAIRTWVAARCLDTDGAFAGDHQLDNTAFAVLTSIDDSSRDAERARTSGRPWRLDDWHGTPAGGAALSDRSANDPTGTGPTTG